jgi:hypothetical protein
MEGFVPREMNVSCLRCQASRKSGLCIAISYGCRAVSDPSPPSSPTASARPPCRRLCDGGGAAAAVRGLAGRDLGRPARLSGGAVLGGAGGGMADVGVTVAGAAGLEVRRCVEACGSGGGRPIAALVNQSRGNRAHAVKVYSSTRSQGVLEHTQSRCTRAHAVKVYSSRLAYISG